MNTTIHIIEPLKWRFWYRKYKKNEVGDHVRISKNKKNVLGNGYTPSWSQES